MNVGWILVLASAFCSSIYLLFRVLLDSFLPHLKPVMQSIGTQSLIFVNQIIRPLNHIVSFWPKLTQRWKVCAVFNNCSDPFLNTRIIHLYLIPWVFWWGLVRWLFLHAVLLSRFPNNRAWNTKDNNWALRELMYVIILLILASRHFWPFVRMLGMKTNCMLLLLYETPASPDVMGWSRPALEVSQKYLRRTSLQSS